MGYTIKIGNAFPFFHKDVENDELTAQWRVQSTSSLDAPHNHFKSMPYECESDEALPIEALHNILRTSHADWGDFCRAANVFYVFHPMGSEFRGGSPGCSLLKKSDLIQIRYAKERCKLTLLDEIGISQEEILYLLNWLEFWIDWALENCETPAIENC